jgi:hypothetical protein
VSDDFKDVSVDETAVEQSVTGAEPVQVEEPVEAAEAEPSPEPVHDDERVFTSSTNIPDAEAYNRQQIAEENGIALGNGGVDGRTVTQAGHAAKAEAAKDRQSDLIEHLEQSERRKDWLERDHDFGGTKMSGHDLAKMIDFISNPHMQDKLRDRLGKSGVPKEKIDKGMKELNEYIDLKKKEQDGGKLSEEQHRRLKEIEKSEEFKVVAKEAERLASERGVQFSKEHTEEMIKTRTATELDESNNLQAVKDMQAQHGSLTSKQYKETAVALGEPEPPTKPIAYVAASARDELPSTVVLKDKFSANANPVPTAAMSEPHLALGGNEPVSLAATANNNVMVAKAQSTTVVASL